MHDGFIIMYTAEKRVKVKYEFQKTSYNFKIIHTNKIKLSTVW